MQANLSARRENAFAYQKSKVQIGQRLFIAPEDAPDTDAADIVLEHCSVVQIPEAGAQIIVERENGERCAVDIDASNRGLAYFGTIEAVFGVPLLAFYCIFGDILSNLIWCGMMIWLSFCAIRGLVYANGQTGAARNMRYFHIGVLCFASSEYLLWTAGCFWPDTSPASPTFWCDMLLTLAILGLLPAARKAVEA